MKLSISDTRKIIESEDYNYVFNLKTGLFMRWGKTKEEDPLYAPFPEILDLEISSGPCSQKCEFCFVPDTKISANGKTKKIQNIKIGDIVSSYDEQTKEKVTNEVLEVYEREYSGVLIVFELTNGKILKVTPEHKFFVKNVGWVEAQSINSDMDILHI
jgi:hypothetical protein